MTQNGLLSKHQAFLHLFSACAGLLDSISSLCDAISDASFIEAHVSKDETYVIHDWQETSEALEQLQSALQNPLIQELGEEVIKKVADAAVQVKTGLPLEYKGEAESGTFLGMYALYHIQPELEERLYNMAVETFGHWGAFWFNVAVTNPDLRSREQLACMSFLEADPSPSDLTSDEIIHAWRSSPVTESEELHGRAIDERNRWIYDQVMAGVKFPAIIKDLEKKPFGWTRISSVPGIKSAAEKFAERHNLPRPKKRSPGRPAGR